VKEATRKAADKAGKTNAPVDESMETDDEQDEKENRSRPQGKLASISG
jgi:hypothetical protein